MKTREFDPAARAIDARLSKLLDSMPDPLVLVDASGAIRYANGRVTDMTGFDAAALVGATVEELIPARYHRAHRGHRRGYVTSGHSARPMGTGLDIRLRCADGSELDVDIALSPLELDGDVYTVATIRDVTERKRAVARLEAINEVASGLLEGRDPEDVLRLVARWARVLVGASLATVSVPDPDGGTVEIRVAEGAGAEQVEGLRVAGGSIAERVMRTREPSLVEDASDDRAVNATLARTIGAGPLIALPIAAGDRAFGALVVTNERGGRRFTDEDVTVLRAFASSASVALEYGRIRSELQRLAVLEDRERIAKDLHDDVIQSLFAEGMALQAAAAVVDDRDAVRERLATAVEHIDRVIRDLRNYIFALRPGAHADRQLIQSLHDLVADVREGSSAEVTATIDERAAALLAPRSQQVMQMAREALSNAVRHADARRIHLELGVEETRAALEVTDDGKGFEVKAATSGHGLANLRARAAALGGRLVIESHAGRGTRLRIDLPT